MQSLKELEAIASEWLGKTKGDLKWESDPEGREFVVGKKGETREEEEGKEQEKKEGDQKGKGRARGETIRLCYQCRQPGHYVAECPWKGSDELPFFD